MRIISDFRDYYDGVQAYGLDAGLVYRRETATVPVAGARFARAVPRVVGRAFDRHELTYTPSAGGATRTRVDFSLIGFCGRFYPLASLSEERARTEGRTTVWTEVACEHHVEPGPLADAIARTLARRAHGSVRRWRDDQAIERELAAALATLVGLCETYVDHELFRAVGAPVLHCGLHVEPHYRARRHSGRWDASAQSVTRNPRLGERGFARLVDPYRCFQAIGQYLSGVLGDTRECDGTAMTEREQVLRHGFDPAYGFRRRPGVRQNSGRDVDRGAAG